MSDDLISRRAAIDAVINITKDETAVHHGWVDPYYATEILKKLPTIEERKKDELESDRHPQGMETAEGEKDEDV